MSEKSHRTAQLSTLAAFLPWRSSKGAGRMTLTPRKGISIISIPAARGHRCPAGIDPIMADLADLPSVPEVPVG